MLYNPLVREFPAEESSGGKPPVNMGLTRITVFSAVRSAGARQFTFAALMIVSLLFDVTGVRPAAAAVLTRDTVWSGLVRLEEDLVIPPGVTLSIRPGTQITVVAAESTKTDPEYISPLTELTVRGTLRCEGTETGPVTFSGEAGTAAGSWAGILVDGGTADLSFCTLQGAENGVQVFSGDAVLRRSMLRENRYGMVAGGRGSRVTLTGTAIRDNDYGQMTMNGAQVTASASPVSGNRKRDLLVWEGPVPVTETVTPPAIPQVSREYRDDVLRGETVWSGRVVVAGELRVPEGARLVVLPGTVVEFRKRDTNGDGIGENGLLIQGVLIAKGTKVRPIVFRSAEKNRAMGDWDAVNLMNSDREGNLLEYCRFEDAYRGLHFHFSSVTVSRSAFNGNFRGIQFQESQVELRNNRFYRNRSAVQGRDSGVIFIGNVVRDNLRGVNIFRSTLTATDNRFSGNAIDGLRVRDATAVLEHNTFDGNRYGLMAQNAGYGRYAANLITGNAELGFSLKEIDNLEITGNFFTGNGSNGISLQETSALIKGNAFYDNRERGMGINSFNGVITGNNFAANGLFALDVESAGDVAAPGNWWGGEAPDRVICDAADLAGRGRVTAIDSAGAALPVAWPLGEVPVDALWRGGVTLDRSVTVPKGITLGIAPKTAVSFAAEVSLLVRGKLVARGESGKRITFSRLATALGNWGEVLLERALDSTISFCDFSGATWGLHSHFTNLSVSESRFEGNYGGIRFRSGPLSVTRSVFSGNEIGIRSFRGIASITGNRIYNNQIGIFVREKGSGLAIHDNDLSGNSGYALRVGDFNDEDIQAAGNWWGTADPQDMIFDARQEEGIGFVRFEPALTVRPQLWQELP